MPPHLEFQDQARIDKQAIDKYCDILFSLIISLCMTCHCRGVINGKAGKVAALPIFSNMLTQSQWEGPAQPLTHQSIFMITPMLCNWLSYKTKIEMKYYAVKKCNATQFVLGK